MNKLEVSDEVVLVALLGQENVVTHKNISSPFGGDHNPSVRLYQDEDKWRWKSFNSSGGESSGDVMDLFMLMMGIDNYGKAVAVCNKMAEDGAFPKIEAREYTKSIKILPDIFLRNPNKDDITYWQGQGVCTTVLNRFVKCVRKVDYKRGTPVYSKKSDLIYLFEKGRDKKLYRPFRTNSTGKWWSHIEDNGFINLDDLIAGKPWFGFSSLKDQMVVQSWNNNVQAFSPIGAETNIQIWKTHIDEMLKSSGVFSLQDGDFAGWEASVNQFIIVGEHLTPVCVTPYFADVSVSGGKFVKDFAEVHHHLGEETLNTLLTEIFTDVFSGNNRHEDSIYYKICKIIAEEKIKNVKKGPKTIKNPFNICKIEREQLFLRKFITESGDIKLKT